MARPSNACEGDRICFWQKSPRTWMRSGAGQAGARGLGGTVTTLRLCVTILHAATLSITQLRKGRPESRPCRLGLGRDRPGLGSLVGRQTVDVRQLAPTWGATSTPLHCVRSERIDVIAVGPTGWLKAA